MTYTLTLSLRGTNFDETTSHETAEDAQAEAIHMNGHDGDIRTLSLSGPLTSVSMIHPSRSDLHDIADLMEDAEREASAWGCNA